MLFREKISPQIYFRPFRTLIRGQNQGWANIALYINGYVKSIEIWRIQNFMNYFQISLGRK